MSNRFIPGLPTLDIDAKLEINGTSPTDVGVKVWNTTAHVAYDTPLDFAGRFAEYVGAKRDWTDEQIRSFRNDLADAIRADE